MSRLEGIHPNLSAFLDMIAWSEGTKGHGDDGYNVLFGLKIFHDYSDHPRIKQKYGDIYTTAAGRYQLLSRYYDFYSKKLNLKDFSPESQDKIALQQIREQFAIQNIICGDICGGIRKCANIWASFPNAGYKQPEKTMMEMVVNWRRFGGI